MADNIKSFISEIRDNVSDLLSETGNPALSFTKYVQEEMCDKANLGEADICYAVIRNEAGDKVLGEVHGYAISISGETISLFYTIYEPIDGDTPKLVSADEYNLAINRLQGYYNAAAKGRCNEMEPSAEDYKICKYIYENEEDITNVRLFLITNGTVKNNLKTPKQRINDKAVNFVTWDINRLYTNLHDGMDNLSVDIDLFDDPDYQFKIPFIEMQSTVEKYQTYIAMLPGEFLYNLYENFNTDLLQSNVRFFKGKKGCNKGIFETLKTKPHRFLAYNNGITATAKDVLTEYNEDRQTGLLKFIENFQILNGGQTTASIYYAKKENPAIDLSTVFVQMKLIVLQENTEEIHPLITRYSNTQTSVTQSDYSTNNPFNQKLQELSRNIIAPDLTHTGIVSHWYYERVSGQYDQDVSRFKAKADKDKFKSENPPSQKFDKCELGKVYTTWKQHPEIAINGPQKCYKAFIEEFKDTVPDNIFFEDFVAMLMLYRFMNKKNPVFTEFHQIKAQMCLYTLAMLYQVTNGNLSLYKIWQAQCLSQSLKAFINELAQQLYVKLKADQPETTTFRDFCKSSKTWEQTKRYSFNLNLASIAEDMKTPGEDTARKKAGKAISEGQRKDVEKYGAAFWDGLSKLSDSDLFNEPECKSMVEICQSLVSGKRLTPVQVFAGQQILNKFSELGLDKNSIVAKSSIRLKRKEKDSKTLFKRIQQLSDDDWSKIKLVAGRACDSTDAKIVKKIAVQKDKSKLTFKQLTVVCRALDQINEKFKEQMKKSF